MQNSGELIDADKIPVAAQRMWTSALTLSGHEFCSIMNYAGRQDTPRLVEPLAVLARAMNKNCVTERGPAAAAAIRKHPDDNRCYRGGGFLDDHRDFFTPVRQVLIPPKCLFVIETFASVVQESAKILFQSS